MHLPQDFNRNIITHSGTDQPACTSEKGFPVILFSHGLGMTREAYTCFCEHLASHGYVVAAVNHTYAAEITTFPDGRSYRYNLQEPVSPGLFASRRARTEYTRASEAFHADLLRIWTQDLRFVLDKLTELNAPDSGHILSGSMNVAKAGMFGHSFGGAAAARTTQQDARFLAVADLDGSLWVEGSTAPLPRPFLLINHANAYRWDGTRSSAMEHLQAGGVNLEIARTGHMDFSDAGLLMHHFMSGWIRIFLSKQEFGRIEPSRCLTVTNTYLLAFFDEYLKGIDAPLLHGPSSEFPEVSLEVRTCEPQE